MNWVVTARAKSTTAQINAAKQQASEWGLPYRADATPELGTAVLVFDGARWTLRDHEGSLRFSPGMARLRIKRFDAGFDEDVLTRLAELREGDRVLDCTFGLGADALMCARVVGPTGRVLALEQSLALVAVAQLPLARPWAENFAQIELRLADSAQVLRSLPARSFDVVLFDPMFGRPDKGSPAFELLRRHASHAELTVETLAEARRVARRWVVVKGARYSKDLRKLGLRAEPRSLSRKVLWARVPGAVESPR